MFEPARTGDFRSDPNVFQSTGIFEHDIRRTLRSIDNNMTRNERRFQDVVVGFQCQCR